MRKIVTSTFVSLNGYFSGPNGEQDWTFPYFSPEVRNWMMSDSKNYDTIIMGEVTYLLHRQFWPNMTSDQDPAADFSNQTHKIVISNNLKDAPWGSYEPAQIISGDIEAKLKELKQQSGKDMLVVGSGSVVQFLINKGLADRVELVMLPVILSQGRLLLDKIENNVALNLAETKSFKNGVVVNTYAPR